MSDGQDFVTGRAREPEDDPPGAALLQAQLLTKPIIGPRCPRELCELIEAGHDIAIASRNSGANGKKPRSDAADDYWGAVEALHRTADIDVRHLVPTRDQMMELLRQSKDVVRSRDANGNPFTNTFVEVDLPHAGVHILVSCGSGFKLDENNEQPAIRRLRRFIRQRDLCLVWGKRMDRWGRHKFEFMGVFTELDQLVTRSLKGAAPFIGDGNKGVIAVNSMSAFVAFFEASGAHDQAKHLPVQTRNGYHGKSDPCMVEGRVRYAAGIAPPPGLRSLRMKAAGGAMGEAMLFIDSPDVLPSDVEVAYGLPMVFRERRPGDDPDQDPPRVDNAELVVFVLKNLGRRNQNSAAINRYLAKHRHSTVGLHRHNEDYSAHYGDGRTIDHAYNAILENLDFYETGTWSLDLGVPGVKQLRITNCFPRGLTKWADPEDFARIRAWMQRNSANFDRRAPLTFSQFRVDYLADHGRKVEQASLHCSVSHPKSGVSARYALVRRVPGSRRKRQVVYPRGTAGLPAHAWNWILSNTLRKADGAQLGRFVGEEPAATVDDEEEARLAIDRSRLETMKAELKTMLGSLAARNVFGEPIITGQLLADLNAGYSTLSNEAQKLEAELSATTAAADIVRAAARRERRGADLKNVLLMVGSLSDVHDPAWRAEWSEVLFPQFATSDATTRHGVASRWDVSGCMLLGTETVHALPIEETIYTGPLIGSIHQVANAVDAAREGVPLRASLNMQDSQEQLLDVMLGRSPEFLVKVRDERLVRILMATCYPTMSHTRPMDSTFSLSNDPPVMCGPPVTEAELTAVANALGEDLGRVRAVWQRWSASSDVRWLGWPARFLVVACVSAAAGRPVRVKRGAKDYLYKRDQLLNDGWALEGDEIFLPPVCVCGATCWAPSRLQEVGGSICLSCRRDRKGVLWDEHFDRWVESPALWSDGPPDLARQLQEAARLAPDYRLNKLDRKPVVGDEVRAAIAEAYLDHTRTLSDIAEDFHVSCDTVAAVARENGLRRGNETPRSRSRRYRQSERQSQEEEL